jgi:hypothetical protein
MHETLAKIRDVIGRILPSPIFIALWIGAVLGYLYFAQIGQTYFEKRERQLSTILRGEAKADYVYALYATSSAHQFLVDNSLLPAKWSFALIDFVGIELVFVSTAWCLMQFSRSTAGPLAGLLWLGITSPLLFRHHFWHPSDFYGVALMCLVLVAAKNQRYILLAIFCLFSGAFWEKAIFVPLIYFAWEARRNGIRKAALYALPSVVATLAYFIFWRVMFPHAPRPYGFNDWNEFVSSLNLAALEWFVWVAPLGVILADTFLNRRKIDSFWLYWLMYAPLLLAVMFHFRGVLYELRSFWILQPIFAGLIATWADTVFYENSPRPLGEGSGVRAEG